VVKWRVPQSESPVIVGADPFPSSQVCQVMGISPSSGDSSPNIMTSFWARVVVVEVDELVVVDEVEVEDEVEIVVELEVVVDEVEVE